MSAAIEMMMEEHQLIKRMLKILRMRCWSVLKSSQVEESTGERGLQEKCRQMVEEMELKSEH